MQKGIVFILFMTVFGFNGIAQQCDNEDFEFGNTANWRGYTGNITSAGKVNIKKAGIVEGRHTIMSGSASDALAASCGIDLKQVEQSGLYSLRLGNVQVGAEAERITHTFVVEPGKEFFLYKYAVVLEDPNHTPKEQPRFEVRVFDKDGNLAPCGEFKVRAGKNARNEGFQLCNQGFRKYWIKDWTVAGADLSQFVGEQVTIEFLTTDCSRRGHSGYAYVEASCKKLDIDLAGFCPSEPGFASFSASVTEGFKKYEWSNGETGNTATFNNLNYGDEISVEVTTFTGCSSTFTKTLEPPVAVIPSAAPDVAVCKNSPFTLSALGQDFGYVVWDHNGSRETTIVESVGVDSVFSFEYYDVNGCRTGIKDSIGVTAIGFDLNAIVKDVTCNGVEDGRIELAVTGGVEPFEYEWSDGEKGPIRNLLSPGLYSVKVSEATGCSQELEIELEEPSLMVIDAKLDTAFCLLNDGKIAITPSGGIAPYVYSWEDDTGETGSSRSGLAAGEYKVTITDDNGAGCIRRETFNIPEPGLDIVIETLPPRCSIDDGELKAVVQGGSGSYLYTWNTDESTQVIKNLTEGTYTVNVEDSYGCTISHSVSLPPPPTPLAVVIEHQNPVCTLEDGNASVVIKGGQEPFEVLWNTGESTTSLAGLTAGKYEVTVIDGNDCSETATVTLQPPPPLLEVSVISFDAICSLEDGSAEIMVAGGTGPYVIDWLEDGRTSTFVDSLSVGTHLVSVTDANGCMLLDSAIIRPPQNPMILELEMTGESYGLKNGTAQVMASGGVPPYGYHWEPLGGNEAFATGLSAGLYQVVVTDQNNCVATDTISVEEIPPIEVPNAFTPNGDQYNEQWVIKDIEHYPLAHVRVFNRWGNEIFESKGYKEPWDGSNTSTPYPMDTYYYIIELNIGVKPFTGYVDIIR